jgi:hypothetical protein
MYNALIQRSLLVSLDFSSTSMGSAPPLHLSIALQQNGSKKDAREYPYCINRLE